MGLAPRYVSFNKGIGQYRLTILVGINSQMQNSIKRNEPDFQFPGKVNTVLPRLFINRKADLLLGFDNSKKAVDRHIGFRPKHKVQLCLVIAQWYILLVIGIIFWFISRFQSREEFHHSCFSVHLFLNLLMQNSQESNAVHPIWDK